MQWLHALPSHCRMKWEKIPYILDLGVKYGIGALSIAMATKGFIRCQARVQPIRSENTRAKRLAFALKHANWTAQD